MEGEGRCELGRFRFDEGQGKREAEPKVREQLMRWRARWALEASTGWWGGRGRGRKDKEGRGDEPVSIVDVVSEPRRVDDGQLDLEALLLELTHPTRPRTRMSTNKMSL